MKSISKDQYIAFFRGIHEDGRVPVSAYRRHERNHHAMFSAKACDRPEEFAERGAAFFGLKYLPHPIKLPGIDINVYWHARFHKGANR